MEGAGEAVLLLSWHKYREFESEGNRLFFKNKILPLDFWHISDCYPQHLLLSLGYDNGGKGHSMLRNFLRLGGWCVADIDRFKGPKMEWEPPLAIFNILYLDCICLEMRCSGCDILCFRLCSILILWQLMKL